MKLQELKQKIEETFPEEQSKVLKEIVHFMDELVKVSDFNELKSIVKELAEDQKEMRQQLKELAEAQKKTEEQVRQLAEDQKEMRQQLKELAEAQKRTEEQVKELAEAQKKTEKELRKLAFEHSITRKELGKLSHSIGYLLEDRAYQRLPVILENQYGIKVITSLSRQIFNYREDKDIEINILGKGIQNQEEIWIIGESKSQLGKKHVEEFIQKRYIYDELFPGKKFYIMITYMTHPKTKTYAEENHIHVFYSYEFPI